MEWAATFEKKARKDDCLKEVSNNIVLKVRLRHSLSDSCSARTITAQELFFQLLGYQRLVSKFIVAREMDLKEKKVEITQAQDELSGKGER